MLLKNMKTDLLQRINNSQEYCEQLVYDLNGEFPDITFEFFDLGGLLVITSSDEDFIENAINSKRNNQYILNFIHKFTDVGFAMYYRHDYFITCYVDECIEY